MARQDDECTAYRCIRARVLTISDRCSRGQAVDLSGPLAKELLSAHGIHVDHIDVVADDVDQIRAAIARAQTGGVQLIFTTGGTGISPRDVTVEATQDLLVARLPGVEDAIRRRGEVHTPTAALSRGMVGLTSRDADACLVVNAPGSQGGVKDAVAVVGPLVAHILDQLAGGDHARPAKDNPHPSGAVNAPTDC